MSNEKKPTVAAIMPHYNHSEFLVEAVESVLPQVDLLVVVDDGSDKEHRDIVDAFKTASQMWRTHRVLFYRFAVERHDTNRGTAHAINTGWHRALLKMPDVDWLTWVSADNVYAPNWMETLLANVGDADAIYSAFDWVRNGKAHRKYTPYEPGLLIKPPHNSFAGPSFIIRRETWELAGCHRGRNAHDYDHWLRIEETGAKIVSCPESLCHFRAHDNRSTILRPEQADQKHWAEEAIKRRGK